MPASGLAFLLLLLLRLLRSSAGRGSTKPDPVLSSGARRRGGGGDARSGPSCCSFPRRVDADGELRLEAPERIRNGRGKEGASRARPGADPGAGWLAGWLGLPPPDPRQSRPNVALNSPTPCEAPPLAPGSRSAPSPGGGGMPRGELPWQPLHYLVPSQASRAGSVGGGWSTRRDVPAATAGPPL